MKNMYRRVFLLACFTFFSQIIIAQPTVLIVKKYPLTVNGKQTTLMRIEQPDGTWGFHGVKGQMFDAIVKNKTDKPTVIHWHGLILPNSQDGVPYVTQLPIPPGGEYHYHFKLKQSGTYWMHSHHDLQVQQFLSAPFIIDEPSPQKSEKDVIMFLGDFTFKKPETILYELKHMGMGSMDHSHHMSGKPMDHAAMSMGAEDLTDVKYDAFLTNYRTLKNPEIVAVKPGETVRLRIIDGSAMTNFFVNTGKLQAKAVAVDGQAIEPINNNSFQMAVGQRIDLIVHIPPGEGTYPILAQGEGTNLQTGLILATPQGKNSALDETTKNKTGALTYAQELQLKAKYPLLVKQPGQILTVNLEGSMMNYEWKINNQEWPHIKPIMAQPNKRIEMVFNNQTGMSHPMHIHGHVFEVTEIDGKKIKKGAMRDTVLVKPNSIVKVQFDTDNPGSWMLHCHMLYHQESGMMTLVSYEGVKIPDLDKH